MGTAVLKDINKEYKGLSWKELVKAPVSAISGVSEQVAADLKEAFGIDTIREFANNKYVCIAQGINSFSKASGQVLDKAFESEEFEQLRKKPVHAITGVSEEDAALLKRAFGIDTIQELAENNYVLVAQTIVTLAALEEMVETEMTKMIRIKEEFDMEKNAFMKMKDDLLKDEVYSGRFVAVSKGKIVDFDDDNSELAKRVYQKYGYIPYTH